MTQKLTTPHPFQEEGISRLQDRFGGRGLIADDPGLGKTLQSSVWALRHLRPDQRPIVVVCPASVKYQWQVEVLRHAGFRAVVLEGTKPDPKVVPLLSTVDVIVLNYDILGKAGRGRRSWNNVLRKLSPTLVIGDECQYLKNPNAARTKNFRDLQDGVPHLIFLGGTGGMENYPIELFPVLNMLRPDKFPSYTAFGDRYCLPPDAPILMADLSEKKLIDVRRGDFVVGWSVPEGRKQRRLVKAQVLDLVVKENAPLQKVYLSNGDTLICTPDHKWHTGYNTGSAYEYVPARAGRPGSKGRWGGSRVMKVAKGVSPKYKESKSYMEGYVHGFFRGDGHCVAVKTTRYHPFKQTVRKKSTGYSVGCAGKEKKAVLRVLRYVHALGYQMAKMVRRSGMYKIERMNTKAAYQLVSRSTGQRNSNEWWAGFLGGMYDAEGSGRGFSQCHKVNPVTFGMIVTGLTRFGFDVRESRLHKSVAFRGGRKEMLRFWRIANPVLRRKLLNFFFAHGGKFNHGGVTERKKDNPQVVKIEPISGKHTTYTLTTSTGNYVAYGYGSKNCDPQWTPWGKKYKGVTRAKELYKLLRKTCVIRRRKADVLKDLPPLVRTVVPVVLPRPAMAEYQKAETDLIGWLRETYPNRANKARKAERMVKMGYLKHLVGRLKLPQAVQFIDDQLTEPGKVLTFGVHREVVQAIQDKYGRACVKVDGGVTGRKREAAFEKFRKDPNVRLLSGNIDAAGAGWNGQAASRVVTIELAWKPTPHVQAESRAHRDGQKNTVFSYYLIARNTIEELLAKVQQVKQQGINAVLDGEDVKSDLNTYDELEKSLLSKTRPTLFGGN